MIHYWRTEAGFVLYHDGYLSSEEGLLPLTPILTQSQPSPGLKVIYTLLKMMGKWSVPCTALLGIRLLLLGYLQEPDQTKYCVSLSYLIWGFQVVTYLTWQSSRLSTRPLFSTLQPVSHWCKIANLLLIYRYFQWNGIYSLVPRVLRRIDFVPLVFW